MCLALRAQETGSVKLAGSAHATTKTISCAEIVKTTHAGVRRGEAAARSVHWLFLLTLRRRRGFWRAVPVSLAGPPDARHTNLLSKVRRGRPPWPAR